MTCAMPEILKTFFWSILIPLFFCKKYPKLGLKLSISTQSVTIVISRPKVRTLLFISVTRFNKQLALNTLSPGCWARCLQIHRYWLPNRNSRHSQHCTYQSEHNNEFQNHFSNISPEKTVINLQNYPTLVLWQILIGSKDFSTQPPPPGVMSDSQGSFYTSL